VHNGKGLASVGMLVLAAALSGCGAGDARPPTDPAGERLVNGKWIEPAASVASQDVGSFPVNVVCVAGGKYAITTDCGARQSLWCVRTADGAGVGHVDYGTARGAAKLPPGLYYGLAAGPDDTVYAAQGNYDHVAVLKVDADGKLTATGSIETRKGDFPSGLALDGRGKLYVANNDPSRLGPPMYAHPGSVAIYDVTSGKEVGRFTFEDMPDGAPNNYPLAVAVLKDGSKCYVASERDDRIYVLNTAAPSDPTLRGTIDTGARPLALLLDRSQSRLFVANSQSDTVSVVDTKTDKVTATVLLRPEVVKEMAGATPTGLALSPDEKWLYVALGDMNAVAVVGVADMELEGFLPAGWYPTAAAVPDGKRLLVVNAKGTRLRYPNPAPGSNRQTSPLNLIEGNVLTVPVPAKADLKEMSQRVLAANRLTPKYLDAENPLKHLGVSSGKITHVIYVIKENRTYDQVLGDLPQGNGDSKYCIFDREITPNQHALAERFVLLDNFYDCGEVSGDGWTWSTEAMANEFTARNVPYQYSNWGRKFSYEGEVNEYPAAGFPAKSPEGKPLSDEERYKNGGKAVTDVAEAPGGHIWDMAAKHGVSYRNYGFFMSNGVHKNGKWIVPDNYPCSTGLAPADHDLKGKTDLDFRRFDLEYADSEAGQKYYARSKDPNCLWRLKTFGKYNAPSRFTEWKREFDLMLKKDPGGGAVPALMMLRMCTDHTNGMNPNAHSPRSMVADNDYCVGQIVEAVSRSPIWKHSAIFVIEDDAQNGPDHIDAHRSTCYVISPYVKRGSVDHTFQNTTSCLKTMELLLGLPPMCQYDAVAQPIMNWTDEPQNVEPYEAVLPPEKVIAEVNNRANPRRPVSPEAKRIEEKLDGLQRQSMAMDFTHADQAPAEELNRLIWKSVKGVDAEPPFTPRGPFWGVARQKDDDD